MIAEIMARNSLIYFAQKIDKLEEKTKDFF